MGLFKYPFLSRIKGVPDDLITALAANFRQVATSKDVTDGLALKVAKAGDTMTGALAVQGTKKAALGTSSLAIYGAAGDAVAKTYIDDLNGILFGIDSLQSV